MAAHNRYNVNNRGISFCTFNLHGLNQGGSMLSDLCSVHDDNIDCIFVQEHWLTPDNLHKITFFSDRYTFYGKSAMENCVQKAVLKGTPWGGAGILIKNEWVGFISNYLIGDRFSAIVLNNSIFVSIYIPSPATVSDNDLILDVITEIDSFINQYRVYSIICGGDFNFDVLNVLNKSKSLERDNVNLFNFIKDNKLVACGAQLTKNKYLIDYTYVHDTLGHYSHIDYILVSEDLFPSVVDYDLFDCAYNLSYHVPCTIRVDCKSNIFPCIKSCNNLEDGISAEKNLNINMNNRLSNVMFRWDHADVNAYAAETLIGIKSVYDSLLVLWGVVQNSDIKCANVSR